MKLEHELIPRTETLPFNLFTFRARDLDRLIPQHWHQSTELIDCLSGSLDVWVEGGHLRLHQGDLLLINPYTVHSTQSLTVNHILVVQLPLPFLQSLTENQFNHQFQFDLNTIQLPSSSYQHPRQCLDKLAELFERSKRSWTLATKIEEQALLLGVIADLVSNHTRPMPDSHVTHGPSMELMNQVTHYINHHFSDELSLHQVASEFNYSDSYFSRMFKQAFSINFHGFVISVRLNDAVARLVNSDESVTDIAQASGFETYRNFYNAFNDVYQVSPSEYRKNSQKSRPVSS